MAKTKPDIFNFVDYRELLDALYKYYKSENPVFSYRYISMHAGASSAGWLPNIIKGRINLTGSYLVKLGSLFKLTKREKEYLELLVAYNQSGSIEEKNLYFEKLREIKGVKQTLLKYQQMEFFCKWYISAIRELLFIFPFKDEFSSLATMIIPPLKGIEVQEAIHILLSTEIIKADAKGYLRPSDAMIFKDPSIKTNADLWKTYMKAKINLGMEAIERFTKEERDISEVYIPLSKANFEQAREEIALLRKKLLVLSEQDESKERVYQCSIQMFPLSEKVVD